MDTILTLILQSAEQTLLSLWHNWPYLLASIFVAAALKLFLDSARVSAFLKRYRSAGILAATTAAVTTPLCSCGTTAVLLGMMASMMPWAPIIAFMVASPLTSPGELVYSAGLFGWPFALTFFAASIVLGLAGGLVGAFLDSRGWLKNQARMADKPAVISPLTVVPVACCQAPALSAVVIPVADTGVAASCCSVPARKTSGGNASQSIQTASCECSQPAPAKPKVRAKDYFKTALLSGRQLLVMFLGFAFIGYFLNGLIPSEWVAAAFGTGNFYSVPLAATLGLPFYINSEASLPLIRALLDSGMSQGAAMAFMISGAGTSIGAIAGALTIARWRVVSVVVSVLWIGAIAFGFLFDAMLATGAI